MFTQPFCVRSSHFVYHLINRIFHIIYDIIEFLTRIRIRTSEVGVSEKEAKHTGNLYHIVTDLERIGDHAENVLGYQIQMKENEQVFSDKALKQLKELSIARLVNIMKRLRLFFIFTANDPSGNPH